MPSAPPETAGDANPLAAPAPPQQLRPPTMRAATLSTLSPFKGRASSQPPGDRLPATSQQPGTGRAGSPGTNGNGGAYGVIGGSRTPSRFGSGHPGPGGMRANSFSVAETTRGLGNPTLTRTLSSHAEELPSRSSHSTSPFPTFSPTSSISGSPAVIEEPLPHPHSPPRAPANVSRSRSQSLAGGPRPTATERFVMPMSALENVGAFPRSFEKGWSPPETSSNMSPFARGMSQLQGHGAEQPSDSHSRWLSGARNAWGASVPENTHRSPLSSSVARAFGTAVGAPSYSTVVGGFDHSGNGGKSGSSSRRHSVSVVGGAGTRNLFGEPGGGMSTVTSPPGRALGTQGFSEADLLPEKLGNALNLEIDENRRRGIDIELKGSALGREVPISQSLPRFENAEQRNSGFRASIGGGQRDSLGPGSSFGSSPARGRPDQVQTSAERAASGESKDGSARSRFSIEGSTQPTSSGGARGTLPPPPSGGFGAMRGLGPVGGPAPPYDPRTFGGLPPPPPGPFGVAPFPGGLYPARPTYMGAPMAGPPSPTQQFGGRPPSGYPGGFYGGPPGSMPGPPPRPQQLGNYGGPFPPPNAPFQPPPQAPAYYPQSPTSPTPHSPSSFSQLSLADLGKGVPLGTLSPTTPLYVVTFKAGRRDVFYCPDPTLLISNGDRVIVEADRGSDLGTVVYDQLTPIDVREWQEKQATAALLSGASQHQPPGMAVAAHSSPSQHKRKVTTGELTGMDLPTLLAGVGPGGQLDLGQTTVRGPLAKEIMPKRIFAKSAQGPEEQARMMEKLRDEQEALIICRERVAQRGLPMAIVDAEYQWDRRKLTFYFKAEKRVDFRDLTKENFRIFKSRIWMSMVPRDDPREG